MDKLERLLFWTAHIMVISAMSALFFPDIFTIPNIGILLFTSGLGLYTLTLSLSIYLDKTDSTRKANNAETQTIGSILKPALLACLVVVLIMSIGVIFIDHLIDRP